MNTRRTGRMPIAKTLPVATGQYSNGSKLECRVSRIHRRREEEWKKRTVKSGGGGHGVDVGEHRTRNNLVAGDRILPTVE